MRIIQLLWGLYWFLDSPAVDGDFIASVCHSILDQARYLRFQLEYHLGGNHLMYDALALFLCSIVFPDAAGARSWQRLGQGILNRAMAGMVREDGGFIEQSTQYQLLAMEIFFDYTLLCRRCGIRLPKEFESRLGIMVEFTQKMCRPDGHLPLLGDSAQLPNTVAADILAMGAAVFPDMNISFDQQKVTDRSWWRLNRWFPDTSDGFLPTGAGAMKFTGLYVMVSDDNTHCVMDAGPFAYVKSPGHGHADALSFCLYCSGKPVVVDTGAYTYKQGPWRDYVRSTMAHNTVCIDSSNQVALWGSFRMGFAPDLKVNLWHTEPGRSVLDAEFKWHRLPGRPVHRRIAVWEHGRLIIIDHLSGRGRHEAQSIIHIAPGLKVTAAGENVFDIEDDNGRVMQAGYAASESCRVRIAESAEKPPFGFVSSKLGHLERAMSLKYDNNGYWPVLMVTVLDTPQAGDLSQVACRMEENEITVQINEGSLNRELIYRMGPDPGVKAWPREYPGD